MEPLPVADVRNERFCCLRGADPPTRPLVTRYSVTYSQDYPSQEAHAAIPPSTYLSGGPGEASRSASGRLARNRRLRAFVELTVEGDERHVSSKRSHCDHPVPPR